MFVQMNVYDIMCVYAYVGVCQCVYVYVYVCICVRMCM